jgi:4-amino-4-deoxy-L-arabinose transferase-like glycosyltransferase
MDDPLPKGHGLQGNIVFLALAFLAELVAWSGLGMAAYVLAGRGWLGWVVAIITVVVVITVWGLVASPKAKAPAAAGLATRIIVFAGAVVALTFAGQLVWAGLLALLIGVSQGGIRATTPRTTPAPEGDISAP